MVARSAVEIKEQIEAQLDIYGTVTYKWLVDNISHDQRHKIASQLLYLIEHHKVEVLDHGPEGRVQYRWHRA